MPFGRRSKLEPAPADIRAWRPQVPGTGSFRSVVDPIIEPFWDGIHVLVHFDGTAAEMLDETGDDVTDVFAGMARSFAEASRAAGTESIVVDAWITNQSVDKEPTGQIFIEPPTGQDIARQMLVGSIGNKNKNRPPMPAALDENKPIYLVLVDLLAIDDESLLDLPLLERKRLLEGALSRQGGVQITPFVHAPGDSFRSSCRAQGFWAVIYKGANSRYTPGSESRDWAVVRLPLD